MLSSGVLREVRIPYPALLPKGPGHILAIRLQNCVTGTARKSIDKQTARRIHPIDAGKRAFHCTTKAVSLPSAIQMESPGLTHEIASHLEGEFT